MEHANVPRENISKEKYPYRISRILSARHIKLPRIQVGFPDGVYHAQLVCGEPGFESYSGPEVFLSFQTRTVEPTGATTSPQRLVFQNTKSPHSIWNLL